MSYRKGAERFYDLFGEKDDVDFVSIALRQGGKPLNSAESAGSVYGYPSRATAGYGTPRWRRGNATPMTRVEWAKRGHSHVSYIRAAVCLCIKNEERLPALFGLSLNEDCL